MAGGLGPVGPVHTARRWPYTATANAVSGDGRSRQALVGYTLQSS